jgi:hypothetical protein
MRTGCRVPEVKTQKCMHHKHAYYLKKIKLKEAKQTRSIDYFFVTTKMKKPDENYDEISVCEVECQTHGDDTDSVATLRLSLIESCETEPSCYFTNADFIIVFIGFLHFRCHKKIIN